MSIFVSIASYRDPELIPTVEDCLAKARWPERLVFGVCWQHGPEEGPLPWAGDPRFRVLDVDWRRGEGTCWARSQIMGLFKGEDHFLQIDSHHRFVQDWDAKLVASLAQCPSPKPILSTYCPSYTPGQPTPTTDQATQMDFSHFDGDGIPLFRPTIIRDAASDPRPRRARFLSGHFLFASGSFVREVPYDPGLYFIGEEITLSMRAYTWGYDLFHPGEILLWHEYLRTNRNKHWNDHQEDLALKAAWVTRDRASKKAVRQFIAHPHMGPYGAGTQRSVEDYGAFAGINFTRKKVQDYTRMGLEPPNPPAPRNWEDQVRRWDIRIRLKRAQLQPSALNNVRLWFVGAHDSAGREIHRQDLAGAELEAALEGDGESIDIERSFESSARPATWTVWPLTRDGQWVGKTTGKVPPGFGLPARGGQVRLAGPEAVRRVMERFRQRLMSLGED